MLFECRFELAVGRSGSVRIVFTISTADVPRGCGTTSLGRNVEDFQGAALDPLRNFVCF